jgi:RNA polymerase sigma-70 factor, ECF subfamily
MIYEAAIHEDLSLAEPDELALLRQGDPAALASAVARYQHRLYRYLLRLVRDPATADDLFQQTWLNVVRHIGRYDARRGFDTWLFSIAHNAAVDCFKRRHDESLEDEPADLRRGGAGALDTLLAAERATLVARQMAALPAVYRETLTLRFDEDMKLEEIAEVVGAPLSTVKSRLRRGLESLRERLCV